MFARPSTWLVLEDDVDTLLMSYLPQGTKVGGYRNKIAAAKNANKDDFDITKWFNSTSNGGYTKGDKIFAVAVPIKTNYGYIDYVVEGERVITD